MQRPHPINLLHLGLCFAALTACTHTDSPMNHPSTPTLFEDAMTGDWHDNWFLDGKKATLRNSADGLFFAAGTVTKADDPVEYHAHHAVLWTKQVFEGDLRISYEVTRNDTDGRGTTLLYIQAQGTGTPPYVEDISAWSDLREIPDMGLYFRNMNLLSLSFRENLRLKRYPWFDPAGEPYPNGGLIEPMVDYGTIEPGKTYRVVVEKRAESLKIRLMEPATGRVMADQSWDLTKVADTIEPRLIHQGRIGLRHMATRQLTYRNFRVERL